ncbi:hypothetical protein SAMN04515667_1921 [Formosa sp. Hel1_31_208]|uniref:THUMP-like domain-containing protein n=1 Tax=Formosa sp. Hel1_31_208 TaxID=1798225 RepID=UPI00087C936C|nr:SAM-dependent methyltransferase [Formosa sp. Hel1_31_208]SDS32567.1 hypothetical protein SAMN04515667_1921 [Formosa sp. Hel1_31_208]
MNTALLNTEIQRFINANLDSDLSKLLLKGTDFGTVSTLEVIEQIEAKLKCKTKLPTWFKGEHIYYPNKLNIEQTSSEIAAEYKTKLLSGNSIIDITGGFGVDAFYFSKKFQHVTHCEINENLSIIAQHNFKQLGAITIEIMAQNGIEYLMSEPKTYDWIYIDPSRRHDNKGKVFFLKDCLPNVPEHLSRLFSYSNSILVKTSPLLDISLGIADLKHVKEIHILAIKNEVKELLWLLEKDFDNDITVITADIKDDATIGFSFLLKEENNFPLLISEPLDFLYEPNSAIMKSGGFKSITQHLKIPKLHQHTHLYTSAKLIDFPGRSFKIETIIPYNKKHIKALGLPKANLSTRNFPETVAQLRKKHRIKDGGNTYIFFTTNNMNERIVIVCSKVS